MYKKWELNREKAIPILSDIERFSGWLWKPHALRPYQAIPARAIARTIIDRSWGRKGRPNEYAVVFARQAGKDEMVAQLLAYILNLAQGAGGQIVLAAPTQRQANISRARLLERLDNPLNKGFFHEKDGYIVGLGKANVRFLSAAPTSNVRGETASLLLVANEAQDIDADRWDAVFDPMAASTNAPTLFLGTVWTARTLLARQMRYLRELEAADGQQRVFLVDWQTVGQHVPDYGARVEAQIRQFGRLHPFIQTEYFLRELDGSGGLFYSERMALMQGSHPRRTSAEPGKVYALLVDVAGEAEQATGEVLRAANPRKDSTAVTVVEIKDEVGKMKDEYETAGSMSQQQVTYNIVNRYVWTGTPHTELYERIVGLARETWWAKYVVVDATGVGAPLAAFLQKALGKRTVIPFVFSSASKSKLGYDFCGIVDGGRYKEYAPDGAPDTAWFWRQLGAVEYRVRQGPTHVMSWGVPNPTVHDDLVMSAALVAVLDGLDWRPRKAVGF
jgi:hypothetical protein